MKRVTGVGSMLLSVLVLSACMFVLSISETAGVADSDTSHGFGGSKSASVWTELPGGVGIRFSPASWKDTPEAIPSDELYQEAGQLEERSRATSDEAVIRAYDAGKIGYTWAFTMLGNVPERRSMQWVANAGGVDLGAYEYLRVRYKSEGLIRTNDSFPFISVYGRNNKTEIVEQKILDSFQSVNDGLWHEIVWKKRLDVKADQIRVKLCTQASSANLSIDSIEFLRELPRSGKDVFAALRPYSNTRAAGRLKLLNLESMFNDRYDAAVRRILAKSAVVDGRTGCAGEDWAEEGVPFRIKAHGNNIIRPAESTDWREQTVDFMGEKIPLNNWMPIQRDDRIVIPVGEKVSEALLLLASELPVSRGIFVLPTIPYAITDIEGFSVELQYADNDNDLVFPYSISDRGYSLRRMLGVYAVPADSSRVLKSIVVKNRTHGVSVNVMAVTVNTGASQLLARVWAEPSLVKTPDSATPRARGPYLQVKNGIITAGNDSYYAEIDCADGFAFRKLVNRRASGTPLKFDSQSGIQVQVGNRIMTGKSFHTEAVSTAEPDSTAVVTLVSESEAAPLKLRITISAADPEELVMNLSAVNTGSAPVNADIRFPVVSSLVMGNMADSWYFFPQYRTVNSNQRGFCRHLHDRGFPMQFFDVYNPKSGGGIALATHNLEQSPVEYSVGKNEKGITAYIQFPGTYYSLAPGSETRFAETAIGFHDGGWHGGVGLYQKWLSSWYRPVNAQDKDWFLNSFVYTTALISPRYSRSISRIPTMVDPVTKRYHVDEYIAKDKEFYNGMLPDFGIFGAWGYDEENDIQRDGEYSTKDYDHSGGLENIRDAVRRFAEQGIPIAPYTISDRYQKDTDFAREHGDAGAQQRKDGWIANDQYVWYACKGSDLWRNHISSTVARVVQDWGVKAAYLDVLGTPANDTCYRADHRHEIPAWVNKWDGVFLKELRERLPETAFWSEYPVTDVNCQYHDGWITYDNLSLNQYLARYYDTAENAPTYADVPGNMLRFVFPRIKQFCFPVGIEHEDWSPLKYLLFNGQGFAPCPYWLHTSDARALINKSVRLQREYLDCFTSAIPAALVPTERTGVYANMWPGKGRTAWTLYNTRYTTVRDHVISVDHRPGDIYFDAWGEKDLAPRIVNGKAQLSVKLGPMGLGCIVRTRTGQ